LEYFYFCELGAYAKFQKPYDNPFCGFEQVYQEKKTTKLIIAWFTSTRDKLMIFILNKLDIHLKFIDDMTLALALNLRDCLVPNLTNPTHWHTMTGHSMSCQTMKM
jgi:hypothetical protein